MPPTRTIMPPAKPQKTERTHEENQERAYIAASRRSDRSLEARVESARRASEIHKRRTGRGLRITEEDVINEEMYEEEEDDLPLPYRNLLSRHLRTDNPEFNNMLSAWLATNVATRKNLEQCLRDSYAHEGRTQNFPNGQPFPNQYSMFSSPMLARQAQQQQQMAQSSHLPTARHAPYPSPRQPQQGFQMPGHQRSQSIALPQDYGYTPQPDSRRLSMPAAPAPTSSLADKKSLPSVPSEPSRQKPSFPPGSFSKQSEQLQQFQNPYSNNMYNLNSSNAITVGPLSTALPPEVQGFLGPDFGFSNDTLNSLMTGSQNSNFDYDGMMDLPIDPSTDSETPQTYGTQPGLKSTLAASQDNYIPQSTYFNDAFNDVSTTPTGTPDDEVDGDPWSAFVEENAWEPSASQAS